MNEQNSPKTDTNVILFEQPYKIYKYVALAISAVICALGAILFLLFSEKSSNYPIPSPLQTLFIILLVTTAMFSVLSCLFFKKAGRIGCDARLPDFFRVLPAAAAIYCIITEISAVEKNTLKILLIISAAITVMHCISRALKLHYIITATSGLAQALFGILTVAKFYLNSSVELNAPAKLLLIFGALFSVFATLADLRAILGENNAAGFVISNILSICLPVIALVAILKLPLISSVYSRDFLPYGIFFFSTAICEIVKLPFTKVCVPSEVYEELDSLYTFPEDYDDEQE
jgi:hypothetical protein